MRFKYFPLLIFSFFFLVLADCFAGEGFFDNWEIIAGGDTGYVTYEEKGTLAGLKVESDWGGAFSRIYLGLANQDRKGFESSIRGSIFRAFKGEETWNVNDLKFMTNDIDFWGGSFDCNLGYAFDLDYYLKEHGVIGKTIFTPFVGYGYKRTNFRRSDFDVINAIAVRETVDEDYGNQHIDFGLRLDHRLNDWLNLTCTLSGGYVFHNKVDNSNTGKMDGGGGYLAVGEIGVDYKISEAVKLALGVFGERLSLEGKESGSTLWPDSRMNAGGGFMRFIYQWGGSSKDHVKSDFKQKLPAPEVKTEEEIDFTAVYGERDDYYRSVHQTLNRYIDGDVITEKGKAKLFFSVNQEGYIKDIKVFSANLKLRKSLEEILEDIYRVERIPQEWEEQEISFRLTLDFS